MLRITRGNDARLILNLHALQPTGGTQPFRIEQEEVTTLRIFNPTHEYIPAFTLSHESNALQIELHGEALQTGIYALELILTRTTEPLHLRLLKERALSVSEVTTDATLPAIGEDLQLITKQLQALITFTPNTPQEGESADTPAILIEELDKIQQRLRELEPRKIKTSPRQQLAARLQPIIVSRAIPAHPHIGFRYFFADGVIKFRLPLDKETDGAEAIVNPFYARIGSIDVSLTVEQLRSIVGKKESFGNGIFSALIDFVNGHIGALKIYIDEYIDLGCNEFYVENDIELIPKKAVATEHTSKLGFQIVSRRKDKEDFDQTIAKLIYTGKSIRTDFFVTDERLVLTGDCEIKYWKRRRKRLKKDKRNGHEEVYGDIAEANPVFVFGNQPGHHYMLRMRLRKIKRGRKSINPVYVRVYSDVEERIKSGKKRVRFRRYLIE